MARERLEKESARRTLWLASAGVGCIVGGEMLCILGPLQYEHVVHITCHAVIYVGIVLVGLAAALQWSRRRSHPAPDDGRGPDSGP